MEKRGPLADKSYAFSVQIVHFCRDLQKLREFILRDQLLRSGTSIGANIEEASQGVTRPDFIHKLTISLKEAYETRYWLRLIQDTVPKIDLKKTAHLLNEVNEIIKMLVASVKTARSR